MDSNHVRPSVRRLTDSDARHLLAEGLIRVCHAVGPSRVALEIGCDEKTVRRARDKDSTLGLACTTNLAAYEMGALADLYAAVGLKLVPLDRGEAIGQGTASCITKLLLELSVALEDGTVDDRELASMRGALDEAGRAIDAMRERLGPKAAAG
jgi:hypothetical protein